LPDTTEWIALFRFAGGDSTAALALGADTSWHPIVNYNTDLTITPKTTDLYGFSALAVGYREGTSSNSVFSQLGQEALWWSTDLWGYYGTLAIELDEVEKHMGYINLSEEEFSVRCLKDK